MATETGSYRNQHSLIGADNNVAISIKSESEDEVPAHAERNFRTMDNHQHRLREGDEMVVSGPYISIDMGRKSSADPAYTANATEYMASQYRRLVAEAGDRPGRIDCTLRFIPDSVPNPRDQETSPELAREEIQRQAAMTEWQQAADLERRRQDGAGKRVRKRGRKNKKAQKRSGSTDGGSYQPDVSGHIAPQPPALGYGPFELEPMAPMTQTQADGFVRPSGSLAERGDRGGSGMEVSVAEHTGMAGETGGQALYDNPFSQRGQFGNPFAQRDRGVFGSGPSLAQGATGMPGQFADFGRPSIRSDGSANWFTQNREQGRGLGMEPSHADRNMGMPDQSSAFFSNSFSQPRQQGLQRALRSASQVYGEYLTNRRS